MRNFKIVKHTKLLFSHTRLDVAAFVILQMYHWQIPFRRMLVSMFILIKQTSVPIHDFNPEMEF